MRLCGGFLRREQVSCPKQGHETGSTARESVRSALLAVEHADRDSALQARFSQSVERPYDRAARGDDVLHEAHAIAGPELGAVALAAAASLSSGVPFLIVRKSAKDYGTSNRLEGVFEPGERVCLVEDVVTTGGALIEALDAVREAGLECRIAVCVVDREEGGADALARKGARLVPLFRAGDLLSAQKTAAKPHG